MERAPTARGTGPDADAAGRRGGLDRIALGTLVLGVTAFVAIAAGRVPWDAVPSGGLVRVPPSAALDPERLARAEHLAGWTRAWSWSSLAVSITVACWLGFGRRGRALAERLRGPLVLRLVVLVAVLTLVGTVVTLPFGIALRRLRLDAGLATGSWGAWVVDVLTADLVTTVATSLGVGALVLAARRLPRTWPLAAGAVAALLVVLGSFVYPLVVEPLSNRFTSLPAGPLRSEVFAIARSEGVRIDDVLVADASRRTTTLNAYVSGFGDSRRVVLYDNLVRDVPRDEVLSVVAHEMAHARYDDVLTGTLLGAAGAVAAVGLLALLVPAAGRSGVGDVGTVPLVLALVAVGSLLASPLQNGISRLVETRADRTALVVTDDPDAFVAVQRRLAQRSLSDPTPPAWSQFWFGSHPTVLQRLGLARAYERDPFGLVGAAADEPSTGNGEGRAVR